MENKKISSIEFWRFIFCVALAIGSLNTIIWAKGDVNLMFNGYHFGAFFFFLAGYFLMNHYQKNKNNHHEAAVNAWHYTQKRIKALYPLLLGSVALTFIVRNVILETSSTDIFKVAMNSLWEFLGLGALGVTNLWNAPLGYVSAILIAGFIIYYVINKSEDIFKILAVVLAIIVYSYGIANGWNNAATILGIPLMLMRVMAGMSIGALLYYPVSNLQKKKLTENVTMVLSVAHIALAMFILYIWFHGTSINELTVGLLILLFVFILLVNKDYISVLYNDSAFLNDLGHLSVYYFASHLAFVYLIPYLFPEMSYQASIVFNILFTLCWAYIIMYIDDYLIKPIFKEDQVEKTEKKLIKKVTRRVKK